jgi:hypothetical protein
MKNKPCEHNFPSYEPCPLCADDFQDKFHTPNFDYKGMSVKEIITKMNEDDHEIDTVNHPPHYKVGGVETIDYIEAKLTPEQFEGYCAGNALKYISRANYKKNATEDYHKAIWYLTRLVNP